MPFTYMASPYSHPSLAVMEERFRLACQASAVLMQRGEVIFSPIAHSHPVADALPDHLRCNHQFWLTQDFPLLWAAERLFILCLPGWSKSHGIGQERAKAEYWHKPIVHVQPEELHLDLRRVRQLMEE